jgi:ABC-type spermidine/putrescine transport system permease subunit II
VFSFNSQRFPTIPLGEFSTQWYETILADPDVWQAALTSIIVAVCTATAGDRWGSARRIPITATASASRAHTWR